MDGLRCIDDFTLRCLDREHRAYFNTLYAGTTQVIVDLCQEGPYQSGRFTHCYKFSSECILENVMVAFKLSNVTIVRFLSIFITVEIYS